ncbi:MAG: tetratricopeptide repeat protein [Cyclobacteriaceae bacterium]
MIFRVISVLLMLFVVQPAFGQSPERDSLRRVIEKNESNMSVLKATFELVHSYHSGYQFDSAAIFNQRAYDLMLQMGDTTSMYVSYAHSQILVYAGIGKLKESVAVANILQPIIDQYYEDFITNPPTKSVSQDSLLISYSYSAIGETYRKLGVYEKALSNYLKALQVDEYYDNQLGLANNYNNLGILYDYQDKPEKAIENYKRALKINQQINTGDSEAGNRRNFPIASNYNNIGIIYKNQKQYDSAEYQYQKALEIMLMIKSKYGEAVLYNNLGRLNFERGDYKEAIEFQEKAGIIQRENNYMEQLSISLADLMEVYVAQERYREAIEVGQEAYDLAFEFESYNNIGVASEGLAISYEELNDDSKALEFYKIFKQYSDSITDQSRNEMIEQMQAKYETEQTEKENLVLRKNNEINAATIEFQQYLIYGAIVIAILVLLIAINFYRTMQVRKKLTREILTQKDQIERQSDRLRELDKFKSRFFANVSHDLRTPLTLIKGRIDQLKGDENSYLSEKGESILSKLERDNQQLLAFADEIRQLISLEEGKLSLKFQSVSVNNFFRTIVKLFSSYAELREVKLTFKSAYPDDFKLNFDPANMQKVMYNLLSNAFKFTDAGDSVNVAIKQVDTGLLLIVEDTGAGISSEKKEKVFERFYQETDDEHQTREGLGIGLSLVKEIVHLHEGSIQLDSKKGLWTKFTIQLPSNEDKAIEDSDFGFDFIEQKQKQLIDEPNLSTEKAAILDVTADKDHLPAVLIVDDHQEVREYIKEVIESDYNVIQAKNGKHALEVLDQYNVDVVLTDLMMPWLDGFGLLEALRQDARLSKIPVLVVSARVSNDDKERVLKEGVNDFISKPFDAEELKLRIKNMVGMAGKPSGDTFATVDFNGLKDMEKSILNRLNTFLISNINKPKITADELASEMYTSERNLYRLVKDLTGKTPLEYNKDLRFNYVSEQIRNRRVSSLTEAASIVGIKNQTQFKKEYIARFKQDPRELIDA